MSPSLVGSLGNVLIPILVLWNLERFHSDFYEGLAKGLCRSSRREFFFFLYIFVEIQI